MPINLHMLLLCLGVSTLCQSDDVEDGKSSRIIGGTVARPGEFPFVVALYITVSWNDPSKCTGSLVTDRWVITAAHCYKDRPSGTGNTRVRAAAIDSEAEAHITQERYSVRYVTRSSDGLDHRKFVLDVALVEVEPAFVLDAYVRPITLAGIPFPARGLVRCTAIGYGRTDSEGLDMNTMLHFIRALAGGKRFCERKTTYEFVRDEWLCLEPEERGSNTCYGDSGGPLACQGLLAGVLSGKKHPSGARKRPCSTSTSVAVYNFAGAYESWIREYIPNLPPSRLLVSNKATRLNSKYSKISKTFRSIRGMFIDFLVIIIMPITCMLM